MCWGGRRGLWSRGRRLILARRVLRRVIFILRNGKEMMVFVCDWLLLYIGGENG